MHMLMLISMFVGAIVMAGFFVAALTFLGLALMDVYEERNR